MAGKNQLKRIRIIDRALRTGNKFTWKELSDKCWGAGIESVSQRTIQNDICALRNGELGFEPAPIATESAPKTKHRTEYARYYYSEKNFTISNSPVQDEETFILMNALDILSQFPEFDSHNKVKGVVDKLKAALDLEESEKHMGNIIEFEKVEYPASTHWIRNLYDFVKNREGIKLTYKPFLAEEKSVFKVIPLILKEFNGRWYLIGFNTEVEMVHNYPLDRIIEVEFHYLDASAYNIQFNPKTYFKDVLGVTLNENGPKEITFQTSDSLKDYITTKPLHHSQTPVDKNRNIFQIRAHLNFELTSKLLSHGPGIEILSPDELRESLKTKIIEMYQKYSP